MKRCVAYFCSVIFGVFAVSMTISTVQAGNLIPACTDPAVANSTTCQEVGATQSTSNNQLYGPDGLLTRVASIITYLGGIAAVIMIILSGFTFMTGSSDPNTLAAAKKTLLYAVVGLIVIVIPGTIIRFVLSKL